MYAADQRILVGTVATLSWQPVDYNGINAAPAGTITIGITKADGTVLVAAGTATSGSADSPRTYDLAATANTTLQRLTATWTDGSNGSTRTTTIDVVGAYYFTINELRALSGLSDTTKFPNAALIKARRETEELIETATGVAFVPRFERQRAVSSNTTTLMIDWPQLRVVKSARIYSDATTYIDLDSTMLSSIAANDGPFAVLSEGSYWLQAIPFRWKGLQFKENVVIEYEHGFNTPPSDLREAALTYARSCLLGDTKRISDRAFGVTTEFGTIQYSLPGEGRPTGIPDVDAIIMKYSRIVPEIK